MKTQVRKPSSGKSHDTVGFKEAALALPKPGRREEMRAGIDRLTGENAKLLEQREVLKKSPGILSGGQPRGMPGSKR